MAGIVHFSNLFRYMEAAETAFFDSLGIPSVGEEQGVQYGWPRLETHCRYRAPLRFQDQLEVKLLIKAMTSKTLHFHFHFNKMEGDRTVLAATGELKTIYACWTPPAQALTPVRIPDSIAAKLAIAPPEALIPETAAKC